MNDLSTFPVPPALRLPAWRVREAAADMRRRGMDSAAVDTWERLKLGQCEPGGPACGWRGRVARWAFYAALGALMAWPVGWFG